MNFKALNILRKLCRRNIHRCAFKHNSVLKCEALCTCYTPVVQASGFNLCQRFFSDGKNKSDNEWTKVDVKHDPELKKILKDIAEDFYEEIDKNVSAVKSSEEIDKGIDVNNTDKNATSSASFYEVEDFNFYEPTAAAKQKSSNNTVTDEEVDQMLSQYNIEEFYGAEPVIEQDPVIPREETVPISLERGVSGVFDVEEIVTVLNSDKIKDICVIRVPMERRYVDYMVIGTCKSPRQLLAVAENIKWLFKKKRNSKDPKTVHIEGLKSRDWLALDMGNIALHLMLESVRKQYDIETLWTCGNEFEESEQDKQENMVSGHYSVPMSTELSEEEAKQVLIDKIKQLHQKKHEGEEKDQTRRDFTQ